MTVDVKETRYVSYDGLEFCERAECIDYESSAVGKLVAQLPVVKVTKDDGIVAKGYDITYVVIPATRHDIMIINNIVDMAADIKDVQHAMASDIQQVLLVDVALACNVILDAGIRRPAKMIEEATNGRFSLVDNDIIKRK